VVRTILAAHRARLVAEYVSTRRRTFDASCSRDFLRSDSGRLRARAGVTALQPFPSRPASIWTERYACPAQTLLAGVGEVEHIVPASTVVHGRVRPPPFADQLVRLGPRSDNGFL